MKMTMAELAYEEMLGGGWFTAVEIAQLVAPHFPGDVCHVRRGQTIGRKLVETNMAERQVTFTSSGGRFGTYHFRAIEPSTKAFHQ